jgi:hypothetical protein
MTYVITYTQGSGPTDQTIRGCSSETEALAKFWAQPYIKTNPKTKLVRIRSYPG